MGATMTFMASMQGRGKVLECERTIWDYVLLGHVRCL